MNSQDKENQEIVDRLADVSRAIREARSTLSGSGYYVGSTNKPIWNRLAKANELVADSLALVAKRMS